MLAARERSRVAISFAYAGVLSIRMPRGGSAASIHSYTCTALRPRHALSIASAEIGKDAEGNPAPVIMVANASAAHGYLSRGRVRVIQFAPDGKEIFRKEVSGPELQQTLGYGLIGGGQTRRMTLPMRLPQPGGRIEAQFTPDN